jgi:dTDP-4-dehydrorhamnose reductase
MKALIVGGKGQLGKTLTQTVPAGMDCRSLDLPEFDITDPNNVEAAVGDAQPDVIINASAYTAVDRAEEEIDLAFSVNATGPKNLALAAKSRLSPDSCFNGLRLRRHRLHTLSTAGTLHPVRCLRQIQAAGRG